MVPAVASAAVQSLSCDSSDGSEKCAGESCSSPARRAVRAVVRTRQVTDVLPTPSSPLTSVSSASRVLQRHAWCDNHRM